VLYRETRLKAICKQGSAMLSALTVQKASSYLH